MPDACGYTCVDEPKIAAGVNYMLLARREIWTTSTTLDKFLLMPDDGPRPLPPPPPGPELPHPPTRAAVLQSA